MSYYINKFILRLNTAFTEGLSMNDASTWALRRGAGALEHIAIKEIKNPRPQVKGNTSDILGMNGVIDATEAHGGVTYKNKPVQVTFQTLSADKRNWFDALHEAFEPYHGRIVDFAFDTAGEVEWYYTGRLSVDAENEELGTLTVKIDTYPFMKNVAKFAMDIPTETSLDRSSNGWSVASKPAGTTVAFQSNTIVAYGQPGDVIHLSRSTGIGRHTMGVTSIRGGEFTFTGNGSDRVSGAAQSGYIYADLTIDGSSYGWTTENGDAVYKPCVVMGYIETPLYDSGRLTLPSNVQIRPEIYNLETCAADILLDGKRIHMPANSAGGKFADAVLPGRRADRSGENTVCCVTAVGSSSNDSPMCRLRFRKERLG